MTQGAFTSRFRALMFLLFAIGTGLGLALFSSSFLAKASPSGQAAFDPLPTPGVLDEETDSSAERQQRLEEAAPVILAPLALSADTYGYVVSSGTYTTWYDVKADGGAALTNPNNELDWSQAINLGFFFQFYENKYSQLYVNDNGLISFGSPVTFEANDVIPMDVTPNNYIAGFWDSLDVGYNNEGAIYYKTYGITPNRAFVAEWYNVTRLGGEITKTVTFEIVLLEATSDIRILYNDVNIEGSSASIGIEDGDGIDGLQYMYHQAGEPVDGRFVFFDRPANAETAPRVRLLPTYNGKMLVNKQVAFQVQVRNTSGTQTDRFDLTYPTPPSGWTVSLRAADGRTLLTDTNANGKIDTGVMAPLTNKTITVLVKTATYMPEGAYYNFDLTGTSTINPYPTASARIMAAVPASMTTAFYDLEGNKKALLDMIWKYNDYQPNLVDPFLNGGNLAVIRKPDKGYVYVWDNRNAPEESRYREIRFLLLNQFGTPARGVLDVDDHASPYEYLYDSNPAVAAAPNGKIGFAWQRMAGGTVKKDICFTVKDANGNQVGSVLQVTSNPGSEVNESPAIAGIGNNTFVLAWVHRASAEANGEIWYAVYDTNGAVLKSPSLIVSEAGINYSDPAMASMSSNRAFFSYTRSDPAGEETIRYRIYAPTAMSGVEYTISGAQGWGSHAVQLAGGNVLVGWSKKTLDAIAYTVLTDVTNPAAAVVQNLLPPNNRQMGYVSIAEEKNGRGVFVWLDYRYLNFLYYAAVKPDGSLLTPPMTYLGSGNSLSLYTSEIGLGIARYDGVFRIRVPLVAK